MDVLVEHQTPVCQEETAQQACDAAKEQKGESG